MRRVLARAAEIRPLVLVWEDLHWTDQATEEFVALLADSLAAHRILMILTDRPGYTPPVGDRTFHTRVALAALSPQTAWRWRSVCCPWTSCRRRSRRCSLRRAEGNPFYVEESSARPGDGRDPA